VPVYNRPHAVLEALASILAQTQPPDRLVVVDDGSSDGTVAAIAGWLNEYAPPFPTELLRRPNGGPASARNHGAQAAGAGELLAFLDSDDLWPVDFVARMTAAMRAHPAAVAASGDLLNTGRGQPDKLRSAREFTGAITGKLFCGEPPGMPATVIRAKTFRQVGGFDVQLRFAEDYDLMLRLSLRGPWQYVPGAPLVRRLWCGETELAQSTRYHDGTWRRARMLEAFAHEHGADAALGDSRWRAHLAHTWYRAGRSLLPLQRFDDARESFAHALAHNPLHLRARWRAALLN